MVLEADDVVGGISRTVERDGWRFDLGGHRFFTKVQVVEDLWHEILPDEDFLMRPRMSRIFYEGKYYDYPLRALERAAQPRRRRGRPLRRVPTRSGQRATRRRTRPTTRTGWSRGSAGACTGHFFKTYTEKVWGVPVNQMPADWAAQRVKSLALGKAIDRTRCCRGATRRRSRASSRSSSTRSTGRG